MATFTHGELCDPRRLEHSFELLPQQYRAALFELLRRVDKPPIDTATPPRRRRRERIDDSDRGARMLQLMEEGLLEYTAARRACIENPGSVPNDENCMRRLVRKNHDGKFSK